MSEVETRRPALTRIHGLDALRGVAILLVVVLHVKLLLMDVSRTSSPFVDTLFAKLAGCGWVGVDLFFVLSGFLITRILLATRASPSRARSFYARRVLRIFPLYYLAVLVWYVTALAAHLPADALPWLLSYSSNLLIAWRGDAAIPMHVRHFWSLAIEEQFYLLWPLAVWVCKPRSLLRACGIGALVSLGLRVWFEMRGQTITAYFLTVCRCDGLLCGAALALLHQQSARFSAIVVSRARVVGAGAAVALAAIFVVRKGFVVADPLVLTAGLSLVECLFCSALVLVVAHGALGGQSWWQRLLRTFGKYSYCIYVIQQPIILGLWRHPAWLALREHTRLQTSLLVPLFLLLLALLLLLAMLSWNLIEKPFLNLKRHFEPEAALSEGESAARAA